MNLKIVLSVTLLAVVSARPNEVNWSKVQPLNVFPSLPFNPVIQADRPEGRITNGEVAEPKQFPYQAGLMLHLTNGSAWCGGSLISDRWILTAGHCTTDINGVDVYLGTWDRTNKKEPTQQIIYVSKRNIHTHEEYDGKLIQNDIALIKLPIKIQFNDYIKPIALPKMSNVYSTFAGEEAIASGWGKISDSAKSATDKLRWVKVPIMENKSCNTWFFGNIKPTMICIKTGKAHQSTCNGDSGGPLVHNDGQNSYLIGVTSFGSGIGCEMGFPGVFTRITSYLDWIANKSGVVNV